MKLQEEEESHGSQLDFELSRFADMQQRIKAKKDLILTQEDLIKSLAKEVGRRNITVNCIAPGVIETDMIAHLTDTVKKNNLNRIPLKKFGKPEDIGKMILFLSSDEASYITGQTFYIDGGISLNQIGV